MRRSSRHHWTGPLGQGLLAMLSAGGMLLLVLVGAVLLSRSGSKTVASAPTKSPPVDQLLTLSIAAPVGPTAEDAPAVAIAYVAPAPVVPSTEDVAVQTVASPVPQPAPVPSRRTIQDRLRWGEEELSKQLLQMPELKLDSINRLSRQWRNAFPEEADRIAAAHQLVSRQQQDLLRESPELAGLPLRLGDACKLDSKAAQAMQTLSLSVRRTRLASAPVRPGTVEMPLGKEEARRMLDQVSRTSQNGEANRVATFQQMLQVEGVPARLAMVEALGKADHSTAVGALVQRAVFDLSADVRQAAIAALKGRNPEEYRPLLLASLRYPWPPAADHAAEALVALGDRPAGSALTKLLDEPDPALPYLDSKTQNYQVREVVRINHLNNCLLCHPPSGDNKDTLRGLVPTPGLALSPAYYASQTGAFVRADITFLRQDFSTTQRVEDAAPWPREQRYDYIVQTREAPPSEQDRLKAQLPNDYPQREAVLYAIQKLQANEELDRTRVARTVGADH